LNEIVAEGTLKDILSNKISLTGKYLSGKLSIKDTTRNLSLVKPSKITITGAKQWNLKNVTVDLPLIKLVGVTGG